MKLILLTWVLLMFEDGSRLNGGVLFYFIIIIIIFKGLKDGCNIGWWVGGWVGGGGGGDTDKGQIKKHLLSSREKKHGQFGPVQTKFSSLVQNHC